MSLLTNMNKFYFTIEQINEFKKTFTKKGAVVAFPTDTIWGLGCLPYDIKAVEKIYNFKNRDEKKPLILLGANIEVLKPYISEDYALVSKIAKKYMPGALTLVVKKSHIAPAYITSDLDTVGIRVPNNPIFLEYLEKVVPNKVLATTSANLSNQLPALKKQDVLNYFDDRLDFILDDFGLKCSGKASTVAGLDSGKFIIYRQGDVVLKELNS